MSDTYKAILEVSRRLFLERGYTATSMREIASRSGIAKATIYHHFPDKERILLALLEESGEAQSAMLEAVRAQSEPQAIIETAVREDLRFLAGQMGLMQVFRRELQKGRELSRTSYGPAIEELRSLLAQAIAGGVELGLFRSLEPEKATGVLMAMIQGSVAGAMMAGGGIDSPEERAEAILDIFFNGALS